MLSLLLVSGVLAWPVTASGAERKAASQPFPADSEAEELSAPVSLDGVVLFRVSGTASFPAERRAAGIASRIRAAARDPGFRPDALRAVDSDISVDIMAGDTRLMAVFDGDARLERGSRKVVALVYVTHIREAIERYRAARDPRNLLRAALSALGATTALVVAVAGILWLWRRLDALLERRLRERIRSLGIQSFQIVRGDQIWKALSRSLRFARALILLVILLVYLQFVLGLFPWTRPVASGVFDLVVGPLQTMGAGLVAGIPNLIFLAVLFVVTRYVLKLVRPFFDAVGRGTVTLGGFDPEWALPTYKMVRLAIVVFAVVVAYPYIPGSESEAFKGMSLFLGVVFSLGSSTAISNIIAGYMMTYRRAFRVGDRVKIGDQIGDVAEIRLQVTHLRTPKNEEVIVPNSTILNSEVVNYSTLARQGGLILHTTVGIGYETPWRQVEAMLLMAADRTPGLLKDPVPFVLQKALGDFAVTYEINVYCDDAQAMPRLYAGLHRSILDVFNEYNVQIMTPAYEGDPAEPKLVPKAQWFTAPAKPLAPGIADGGGNG
jgi:small-conductance mechanosensitive channel